MSFFGLPMEQIFMEGAGDDDKLGGGSMENLLSRSDLGQAVIMLRHLFTGRIGFWGFGLWIYGSNFGEENDHDCPCISATSWLASDWVLQVTGGHAGRKVFDR